MTAGYICREAWHEAPAAHFTVPWHVLPLTIPSETDLSVVSTAQLSLQKTLNLKRLQTELKGAFRKRLLVIYSGGLMPGP